MKTPRSIFLVRHGSTLWNEAGIYQGVLDSPLSETGRLQAGRIADFLAMRGVSRLYVSPLGRARATAEILNGTLHCPLHVVEEFREMDLGMFQGKPQQTMKELFSDFFEERKRCKVHTSYPGGESYYDVYLRVLQRALVLAAEDANNIVIVGHEGINRIIRGIIEERPLEEAVNLRQKNNEVIEYRLDEDREIVHEV